MPGFTVSLRRQWFGEALETKLAELDHEPSAAELLAVAKQHQLGGGATLYVRSPRGTQTYRVRDLHGTAPSG